MLSVSARSVVDLIDLQAAAGVLCIDIEDHVRFRNTFTHRPDKMLAICCESKPPTLCADVMGEGDVVARVMRDNDEQLPQAHRISSSTPPCQPTSSATA